MDLTMPVEGHLDQVKAGDEAVLIGRQDDKVISADEVVAAIDTINYEIVNTLTARVLRVYGDAS